MSALDLRELTDKDESAFFEGLKEWPEEDLTWHTFTWKPGMTYAEMLDRLRKDRLGIDLPVSRVPHTIVRRGLQYCRDLGLHEIMITCGDTNTPSVRIIESLGARLADRVLDDADQEMIRQYWLKLDT